MSNQIITPMSKEIEMLCIFLKILWENTKAGFAPFNMSKEVKDANLPFGAFLSTILIRNGIVEFKRIGRVGHYKWTSHTEPNAHMAESVSKEMHKYGRPVKKGIFPNDSETKPKKSQANDDIIIITCESKYDGDRLQGLLHGDEFARLKDTFMISVDAAHALVEIRDMLNKYIK